MNFSGRILISRTDNIGDVILTFPMIGLLKRKYPEAQIYFLGKTYTKHLIKLNKNIRGFLNYDELVAKTEEKQIAYLKSFGFDVVIHVFPRKDIAKICKKARIRKRIGTAHRIYHWFTCNKLVFFSRKRSNLHEAQLNIKLLKPFKIKIPPLNEIHLYYDLKKPSLDDDKKIVDYYYEKINIDNFIDPNRINLIIHPKSKGSAIEWGLNNFAELLELLPENKYKIFMTGTKAEGELLKDFSQLYKDKITDVTGIFDLEQLIYFISITDGLIAASTGPLHIAAALGKFTVGIFSPTRPIFPKRWAPLGRNAKYVVNTNCKPTKGDDCVTSIEAKKVREIIYNFFENQQKQK